MHAPFDEPIPASLSSPAFVEYSLTWFRPLTPLAAWVASALKGGRHVGYDEGLAERIRTALRDRDDVAERQMFGGITFMVAGRMACGVIRDDLVVRVGPEGHDAALSEPHARPMDFTGRPMRGMVYVEPAGLLGDADLARWVERAVSVATAER